MFPWLRRSRCDRAVLVATLQSLFEESELRSMRAKSEAEQAARAVLQRSSEKAAALPMRDIARSLEHIARARAYEAFIAWGAHALISKTGGRSYSTVPALA